MTKKDEQPTTFAISAPSGARLAASFKFESGESLKDEGRIDSETVKEYVISEPGKLRLFALVLEPRENNRDED